ncbi:MAG: DUF1905 domain-containing protein [Phycisphaeraceae bacterium]|nr:DUF1905 domain-containing protein [Phycisphaeraceae bacterium]
MIDPCNGTVVRFTATLHRPAAPAEGSAPCWAFVLLPKCASQKFDSRGQVPVEGTLEGSPVAALLEPDGEGGHWLPLDRKLCKAAGVGHGDSVRLELRPATKEIEPVVPADLRAALKSAPAGARRAWKDITPAARRDWVHWVTSGKKAETRVSRIEKTCDMLAHGKRRPCCFDRSGMYSKSLGPPAIAPENPPRER